MSLTIVVKGPQLTENFEISSEKTILDLKKMIDVWCGVDVGRQVLSKGKSELSDDLCLIQLPAALRDLTNNNLGETVTIVLHLEVTPLVDDPKFTILLRSKDEEMKVRETKTVADLKGKIERRWGIAYRLITLRRLNEEMENHLPLSQYYVCPKCEVQVVIAIECR